MSLRINFNSAALQAHRQLSGSDSALGKSIERLSSGFRINSAGDDPAGLVISEKLRAQVGGLAQAVKNAGDAVNMVKTAEGSLSEVHSLLRSMRDLAVHASNTGANDTASLAADQQQIQNVIASIDKITVETQFGNKRLLDGTAGITASIAGPDVVSGNLSNTAITLVDGDQIYVDVTTAAEKASVVSADLSLGIGEDGTVYVNSVGVNYVSADTDTELVDKINAVVDQTGVKATSAAGVITLETLAYGGDASVTVTSATVAFLGAVTSATDTGVDVAAEVTTDGTTGHVSDSSWAAGSGLILGDSRGNRIVLTEAAGIAVADLGVEFTMNVGTLNFQVGAYAGQTREVSISSAYANQLGASVVAGENASTLNVTTFAGAQVAIQVLDAAIADISTMRANLGAVQKNTLESAINSLTIAKENIAASESTIRDSDMAAEMIGFTKYQILQQAGVAMLAQANQAPQALLALLR